MRRVERIGKHVEEPELRGYGGNQLSVRTWRGSHEIFHFSGE